MEKIAVVTDTGSNLSFAQAKELGIYLLPLQITIDETTYQDTLEISTQDIYKELAKGKMPKTSMAAYQKIYDLFEDTNAEGGCIISGKMVSKLKINMYREPWRSYPETILDVFSDKLSETLIECFEHVLCQDEKMQDTIAHYLRKSLITKFKGSVTSNYSSRKFLVTC